MATLIKMRRDSIFGDEREADVHPDEVQSYLRGGYRVIESATQAAKVTFAQEDGSSLESRIIAYDKQGRNSREIAVLVGVSWQRVAAVLKNK